MKRHIHTIIIACTAMLAAGTATAQDRLYYYPETQHAALQLRTNALYDLALCPNIGIEVQTDIGLALTADYIGAWWNSPSRNRYYSNYGLQAGLRYYVSDRKKGLPYARHHIDLYGQMATYDFEFGGKGYMSRNLDMTWGIGAGYGYTLPLSERFSIDFMVGFGYLRSRYLIYHPSGEIYVPERYKVLDYFGPTRLEATLVWNINKKNNDKKKSYFEL